MTNLSQSASDTYKSKRRLLLKLEKQHIRDLKRRLPSEIIAKIVSFLESPKDIKNCMTLCKDVRISIFGAPDCMRKFEYNLDVMLNDWRQGFEFLQTRGKCIRSFRYDLFIGSRPLMKLVLNQMPNLEELNFEKRKVGAVKSKKAADASQSEDDDPGNDEADLQREKNPANGCADGIRSENGDVDKNSKTSKKEETSNKVDTNTDPVSTTPLEITDQDDLSDYDNGFNSDLETEDENDSDDDSYKESVHSSDDESSMGAESVGEIELHSDESSEEFSSDEEDLEGATKPAKLRKLRSLKINLEDLQDFVDNTQDVKALEKLSVVLSEFENEEVLVNFLNDQVNLKELDIVKHKRLKELKLTKANDPKFSIKLKKLKVKLDCRNYESLANFMNTQVDSIEELDFSVGLYRNTQHFHNFFQNAVNLTTLTLRECLGKFVQDLNAISLENVKYFDQKNQSLDLDTVYAVFPNLETFKCFSTSWVAVSYPKLTTLDVKIVDLLRMKNVNLPNLKNFAVRMNMKNVDEENWSNLTRVSPNIENLLIQTYDYEFSNGQIQEAKSLCILENLRLLSYIKTFSYKTTAMPQRISEFQCSAEDTELVKIDINVEEKVAKVSQYLVQNHKRTFAKLCNDFEGFKFYEIRAESPKRVKLDPRMFAGIEEPNAKRQKVSDD